MNEFNDKIQNAFTALVLIISIAGSAALIGVTVAKVKVAMETLDNDNVSLSSPDKDNSFSNIDDVKSDLVSPTTAISPTTTTTPVLTPTAKRQSGCIVTISGKKYDVTTLRQTHSGGDIFTCGTDMTAKYQGQHGTNMIKMNKYLISGQIITPSPTSQPTISPTNNQSSVTNGGCIVTISGNLYDVTTLRQTHSGGDIFTCGTDMTAKYQGQHGTGTSLINKYLVSNSGNTNSQTGTNTSTKNNPTIEPTKVEDDHDEPEDD